MTNLSRYGSCHEEAIGEPVWQVDIQTMKTFFSKLGLRLFREKRGEAEVSTPENNGRGRNSRYMPRDAEALFFKSGRRPLKMDIGILGKSPADLYRSGESTPNL